MRMGGGREGGGGALKGFFVIFFEATPQLEIVEPELFEIRNSRTSIQIF